MSQYKRYVPQNDPALSKYREKQMSVLSTQAVLGCCIVDTYPSVSGRAIERIYKAVEAKQVKLKTTPANGEIYTEPQEFDTWAQTPEARKLIDPRRNKHLKE